MSLPALSIAAGNQRSISAELQQERFRVAGGHRETTAIATPHLLLLPYDPRRRLPRVLLVFCRLAAM
jgi:hypothetical protein